MGILEAEPAIDRSLQRVIVDRSADLHTITNADGVYRFVSSASLELFGWEPDSLIGEREEDFVHPDDVALVIQARRGALPAPARATTTVYRFGGANGTYRWTEALSRLVDVDGEQLVVSVVRDIEERKKSEFALLRQASTDPLTGLANRSVFMDRLEQALRRLERRAGLVAVLFLDLDRFKLINDSVGHHMGDAILLQMAERLRRCLRPEDTLSRLGGDEFAIVVEDMASAEDVEALGTRIIAAGRAPFTMGEEQYSCTTSLGIAVTSDARRSPEDLLQEADLALYRAKDNGRDRAEVFDELLRTRAIGRLTTERMLRRAIAEDRLRVEFQPIVELRSGKTVAAEALVRVWDPDQAGLIAAESFIDVAEEAGLLGAIDDWVLARTIEQAAQWFALSEYPKLADIAINVTARHLADPRFAESIIDTLAAFGLPTRVLQLELTERVLMEASHSAMTGLKLLRDAGLKVGLDKFGTGYSSLSYLRQFPLDFVKIDRSFVDQLPGGAGDRAIVAAVIDLAHALGMYVVAAGIETQPQLDQLMALGCDRAQGFLLGTAGPPQRIEERVLGPRLQPDD